jgi:hypothetical protein
MRINFHTLLHPDWRYILILIELIILITINQAVLSLDASVWADMSLISAATLLPLIIGYPIYHITKKEKLLNLVVLIELIFVFILLNLFWFLFI